MSPLVTMRKEKFTSGSCSKIASPLNDKSSGAKNFCQSKNPLMCSTCISRSLAGVMWSLMHWAKSWKQWRLDFGNPGFFSKGDAGTGKTHSMPRSFKSKKNLGSKPGWSSTRIFTCLQLRASWKACSYGHKPLIHLIVWVPRNVKYWAHTRPQPPTCCHCKEWEHKLVALLTAGIICLDS